MPSRITKKVAGFSATAVALAHVLGALTIPALASPVLDQEHVVVSSIAETPSDAQEAAQTFTVGISGPLAWIEVQLGRFGFTTGNAVLTVYGTVDGVPNSILGSGTVNAAMVPSAPDFVVFDLMSQGISAQVDDVLAFGIKNDGSGPYIMPHLSPSSYPGGRGMRRTLSVPPGPWQSYTPERDFGFRTYVGPPLRIFGDFNNDGSVDAADYVVWRTNHGALTEAAINHNGNGLNGVDDADYALWRANFNPISGSGAVAGAPPPVAVPEPRWAWLLGMFARLRTRRRFAKC